MSQYKLIAFDMDGTLLSSSKTITPKTLKAINDALDDGKTVILSTGRGVAELKDFLPLFPKMRYVVCVSGALVYDLKDGKVIHSLPLPRDTVSQILSVTKAYDIMVQFLTSDKSVVEADKESRMADYKMSVYQSMYDNIVTRCENIYNYFEENDFDIFKVNLYHRSAESRQHTFDLLKDVDIEKIFSERTSIECSVKGVTKGTGLEKLCEYLGISMSEVIGVGDANNDLDVLNRVGLAVAMGNANNEVKSLADVIVSDNDHDGCSEAMTYLR